MKLALSCFVQSLRFFFLWLLLSGSYCPACAAGTAGNFPALITSAAIARPIQSWTR
jgi:hypothetical protein